MALKRVTSGKVKIYGHYALAQPCLPDNYLTAYKRWQSLPRRSKADSNLFGRYKKVLHQQLEREYCQVVPRGDFPQTHLKLFLPHHSVINSKKLRVGLDCVARYLGASLNDMLLSVMQLRLPAQEQGSSWVLWTDNLSDKPPSEYQMKSHPFGARSSPICANFTLREMSKDFGTIFNNRTVKVVGDNFYFDDCLISSTEVEEQACLLNQLKSL